MRHFNGSRCAQHSGNVSYEIQRACGARKSRQSLLFNGFQYESLAGTPGATVLCGRPRHRAKTAHNLRRLPAKIAACMPSPSFLSHAHKLSRPDIWHTLPYLLLSSYIACSEQAKNNPTISSSSRNRFASSPASLCIYGFPAKTYTAPHFRRTPHGHGATGPLHRRTAQTVPLSSKTHIRFAQ